MWFVNILKSKMVGSCVRICWPSLQQKNYTRSKHRLVQQFYFSSTVSQPPGWPVSTYHSTDYDWLWGWGNADTSALKCWSIPLSDNLDHYSVNTPGTPRLTLERHSIDTLFDSRLSFIDAHESVVTRLTIDWLLIKCWLSVGWPSIYHNWIHIEILMCRGYQSKVLIDTPWTYL